MPRLIVVGLSVAVAITLNVAAAASSAAGDDAHRRAATTAAGPGSDRHGGPAPIPAPPAGAPSATGRPKTGTRAGSGPAVAGPQPTVTRAVTGRPTVVTMPPVTQTVTAPPTGERPSGSPTASPSETAPVADLIAGEDFDGDTLGPQWGVYKDPPKWDSDHVRVSNGELQLVGEGRDPTGKANFGALAHWAANGVAPVYAYGVWKVRARFDAGAGYGATIGLYSDRDSEFLTMARLDDPTRTSMLAEVTKATGSIKRSDPVPGNYADWNTYTIEWRPNFIVISVNDTVVFDTRTRDSHFAIPTVPMYFYVKIDRGPTSTIPAPDATTPDTVVLHVDWVRYYR